MNSVIRIWLLAAGALVLTACVAPMKSPDDQADTPPVDSGAAAVISLIDQARLAYQQGAFEAAIATAERGLRIDRREPEFYLVLAQSYMSLSNPEQARQFAQQGLRFSPPDSHLYQALETVHNRAAQRSGTLVF